MVKGNGAVYSNPRVGFRSSRGEDGLSSRFINLLEERRSLGLGVSAQDQGGVPREILRTRLCGALASSGERARLALCGYPLPGHLACEGKNPSLQATLASPLAGTFSASPPATKL